MRELSACFMSTLKDGFLHPILERIKRDHTLMLAIRDGYINIYYRGGNLIKLEEGNNTYKPFFDNQYVKAGKSIPDLPKAIKNRYDAEALVDAFSRLKEIMDLYFSEKPKPEREFQQLVARENNFSTISNESEYFLSDIEFDDRNLSARFDMLAVRWLASGRKSGNCRASLIEMKYGDDALAGSAGLIKHLKDINNLISDKNRYNKLLDTMEAQIKQLDDLGLLKFNRCSNFTEVKLDRSEKPEVIIILANHNPRSKKLKNILNKICTNPPFIVKDGQPKYFDLRFFVASFGGYGLHSDCMLPVDKIQSILAEQ